MNSFIYSSRIANMETSIFTTMSKLAVDYGAVNLGQGFPDFDGPDFIFDFAHQAMQQGKNQYAPMPGILSLRQQLAGLYSRIYGFNLDPASDFCITAGATEALFSTIMAFINPGDEVVMFEPFYDAYIYDVVIAGGVPKFVTLFKPDFEFDLSELESEITNKTKLLILNNPHNPTGKVFTKAELQAIADLCIKHNLLVISDEVYEFLTFDEAEHIPIATLPGMFERTITISSAGKTYSITGWKIGWAYGNSKLIAGVQKVHQWTTFAVNTPGQHAVASALAAIDDYLPEFRQIYSDKRNLMYNLLLNSPFKPHKPKGSYFMMADIPHNLLTQGKSDMEIAEDLVKHQKVATIPPSVFYGKSGEGATMLRLCFAKNDDTIMHGIENLGKIDK